MDVAQNDSTSLQEGRLKAWLSHPRQTHTCNRKPLKDAAVSDSANIIIILGKRNVKMNVKVAYYNGYLCYRAASILIYN